MNNNKNSHKNITAFADYFLAELDGRHKEIIRSRYGLDTGKPLTLQAIGDKYGITRERVRQIESVGISLLRKKTNVPYLKSFVQAATSQLKKAGGVQKEDQFFANVKKSLNDKTEILSFANHSRFLLELSGSFLSYRDNYNNDCHYYWYLTNKDKKQALDFISKFESNLNKNKDAVLADVKKFDEVFYSVAKQNKISNDVGKNYLAISKKFGSNPFNIYGLMNWSEINPKTARDWAYVILRKEKKPLHFSELSSAIAKHRKNKRTNLQTVHNELIKDGRFVLVGRGLYGLKEFGLIPGTAKEIINHVLKKNGPMRSRDVIKLVKEQRFFKDGTILINLQNRKHFKSLPDGRYHVKEA